MAKRLLGGPALNSRDSIGEMHGHKVTATWPDEVWPICVYREFTI